MKSKDADSNVVFKLLDPQLLIKRVRPISAYLLAYNTALQEGAIAKCNLTSVELKTFTFCSGSQSLSIDNVILGPIQKRILFAMIDNKVFLGSVDTNPFEFHYYNMDYFSLYINCKQIPSGGLHLNTDKKRRMSWHTGSSSRGLAFAT